MVEDTVMDALVGVPKTKELYLKLLKLYASCGGCVLICEDPIYVYKDGAVFEGTRQSLQASRPGESQQGDILDELLLVAEGIKTERYNGSDKEVFETVSTHVMHSVDRSKESFERYYNSHPWIAKGVH